MASPTAPSLTNLESFHSLLEFGENGTKALQRVSASLAYRKYSWLTNLPAKNVAGNFRGMILNSQAKSAFLYLGKAGDFMGHVSLYLSVAEELQRSYQPTMGILNSRDDGLVKAARISSEVSGICIRTLGKIGTGFVGAGAMVLQANLYLNPWCYFGDVCKPVGTAAAWLKDERRSLETEIDTIYSGGSIYSFVTDVVDSKPR